MKKQVEIEKVTRILFFLNIFQFLLIIGLIINRILFQFGILKQNILHQPDFLLCITIILMIYNIYFGIRDLQQFDIWKEQIDMQKDSIRNIEKLNRDLRAQRHDFLNHIQILYSLIELEEYNEASTYLHKLYGAIEKLNNNIKTEHPAVNALLQAKSSDAAKRNIQYKVQIQSKLHGIGMPAWELCRCLGNLIDNAITASEHYNKTKEVFIHISETITDFVLKVENKGKFTHKDCLEEIFKSGFTTKKGEGHGMGLYIVKEIVSSYKGHIDVIVEDEKTCFIIYLPKKID